MTEAWNLLTYKVYTNSCAIVYENNTVTLHHVCSEFGICFILTQSPQFMAKEGELLREGSTSLEGDQCPICFAVYLAKSAVETNCGHVLPTVYSECAEGIIALAVGKMFMLSTDNFTIQYCMWWTEAGEIPNSNLWGHLHTM